MLQLRNLRILAAALVVLSVLIGYNHGAPIGVAAFVLGGLAVESLAWRTPNGQPMHYLRAYTGAGLSDIFIPKVYGSIQPNDRPDTTAFALSGVAVNNPLLTEAAMKGTRLVEVPLWGDLDASSDPNLSDATDTVAVPGKVTTTFWQACNAFLNKGYGAADLAVEMSHAAAGVGNDGPLTRIRNRFGSYWAQQFQKRIISSARGVLADNTANDSGDMMYNIALETTVGLDDTHRISADAIVEACFTMGDQFNSLAALAVHSVVYKKMVKQQLITYIRDAEGKLLYETYLGRRVIIDDGLPVVAGTTSGVKYLTILFGSGAFGYGEGAPKVPAEVDRKADGGNGGGLENIWERKTWLIHPAGFKWTDNTRVGESPTRTELQTAANWDRVVARKSARLAFLWTNG